jgi:hypothetical protein
MKNKLIELKELLEHIECKNIGDIIEKEQAHNLLLGLIEKSRPTKPVENYNWCDLSDEQRKDNSQWYCGICSREVDENMNYCSDCGTKINWWEEEDVFER